MNGAFTFSPDGNPLVGPVPASRGYWLACGVMAGFLQGGGVGKALAEWMIHGEPEEDVYGLDIARYGAATSNHEYIRQTTGEFYARRFVMTYPNEQLPAGRPLKTAPAYDAMTAAGCQWGNSWGLEVPLYFAPPGFKEMPTLKRSNAFDIVGAECRAGARRRRAPRYRRLLPLRGDRTRTPRRWLDRLMACRLPKPGRARLAPMLSESGRLKGDLTALQLGRRDLLDHGLLLPARLAHALVRRPRARGRLGARHLGRRDRLLRISGPKARALLERVTHQDVSNAALPFMGARDHGRRPDPRQGRRASRSRANSATRSTAGAPKRASLRRTLLEAGRGSRRPGIRLQCALSLRLEKSFGIWSAEFTQAYTPRMTGMDRLIAWDKADFIGRDGGARRARRPAAVASLVTLEIDAARRRRLRLRADLARGAAVGFVTSGGYGHCLGKSLAMALVAPEAAALGTALSVHVVGVERKARVIAPSPYDPDGKAMRG